MGWSMIRRMAGSGACVLVWATHRTSYAHRGGEIFVTEAKEQAKKIDPFYCGSYNTLPKEDLCGSGRVDVE